MGGAKAADGDAPECRQDVTLDLAAVAIPGADPKRQSLGGQPPRGEEGPEGQRANLVVRAVALAGEPGGERFGLGSFCACGVPAATLTARDRVEAFVDH